MCCISVLYKLVVCVLYFSKEKNQLITGKSEIEEQYKSSQKDILKSPVLAGCTALNQWYTRQCSDIKIQNLDVTQETKAKFRSDKN